MALPDWRVQALLRSPPHPRSPDHRPLEGALRPAWLRGAWVRQAQERVGHASAPGLQDHVDMTLLDRIEVRLARIVRSTWSRAWGIAH